MGAGVIGSVYAGLLADAGHDVTVVGRGGRLDNLRHQGLRLRSVGGMESRPSVSIVDAVPDTPLDLVVIAVRREQAVFAAAQAGRSNAIDALLFGNFAGMVPDLAASMGRDRAMAGFPGVGGRMERDGSVTYVVIGQQPTVVGTIGGSDKAAQSTATTLLKRDFPPSSSPTSTDGWDLMGARRTHGGRRQGRGRACGRPSRPSGPAANGGAGNEGATGTSVSGASLSRARTCASCTWFCRSGSPSGTGRAHSGEISASSPSQRTPVTPGGKSNRAVGVASNDPDR